MNGEEEEKLVCQAKPSTEKSWSNPHQVRPLSIPDWFREGFTIIAIYVDDILIACRDSKKISRLVAALAEEFEIKDLVQASYCLGIEFSQGNGEIGLIHYLDGNTGLQKKIAVIRFLSFGHK